jgi:putative thiamine transport system substrate-binding protein
VKLDDTANAVAKVLAEKAAGKNAGGSVDLIWINGENFASMKRQDLLMAPDWTTGLPNWAYVDHENKPTILTDFTIPTDGLESPWGGAKMVFFHDSARTPADSVPHSSAELLAWAERNPGRFSYPQPPDFIGSSFLKQVLIEVIADRSKLGQPVVDATVSATMQRPCLPISTSCIPNLWRSGKAYPQNYPDMKAETRRRRTRHHLRFQSFRGLGGNRGRRTARHRAFLHLSRRHARQHPLRRNPLQRGGKGRCAGVSPIS